MADRFPLTVNQSSRKIEEMISGDNLDLTGNGIAIGGSTGVSGQYLKSDGGVVSWDNPGDVYLTASQVVTNKTFESCILSGSANTFSNIPNSSLVNNSITINGTAVALGGTVTTPDNNTTYSVSAQDGLSAAQKIIRLTSGGSGAVVEDEVVFAVGNPASVPAGSQALVFSLDRTGDTITLSGTVQDNDTKTLITATGGSPTSGTITFVGTNAANVSMSGSTVTINGTDTDSKTKIRVGTGGTYIPADNTTANFTFLQAGGASVSQAANGVTGDPEITISPTDTVTRVRGGTTASFLPTSTGTSNTDITFVGGTHRDSSVSVIQNGNSIEIDAYNDDTITKIGSTASNGTFALAAGDFRFTASNAASLTQTTDAQTGITTIDISSTNTDTGAGLTASNGVILSSGDFRLKNAGAFTDQTLLKWDSSNSQLVNSAIVDNGTDVIINGNLSITGTTTTLESTVLQVADPIIELRRGNSLSGADGGIQVNRTTDANGVVQTWIGLQWYETGGYFRTIDNGGVSRRLVTESETQTLSNKTLASASFTGTTTIGILSTTTINGLTITPSIGSTLDFADQKTFSVSNNLELTGTDGATIDFGTGGAAGARVTYTSDTLAAFSSTTSTQLRGVLSDPTGNGSCVFNTSPTFISGINTTSTSVSVFNATATTVNAFGAATDINFGATTGTTTIAHSLEVNNDVTLNTADTDTFTVNGIPNFENNDITIRGTDTNPMTLGRGNSAVSTNTALGVEVLSVNQGGSQNVGVGYQALANNVSGLGNVAVGDGAMRTSDVGDNNVSIGKDSCLSLEGGDNNVVIGNSAMYGSILGSDNVCLGAFAGYNMTGNGNVLIGSGRTINTIVGPTYSPGSISGSNQLVIGTSSAFGQGTWITGSNTYDVTIPNNLGVGGNLTLEGNLIVNGTTTTLNVQTITIDDNALELAATATAPFAGNFTSGSPVVTNVDSLTGVIPGMTVNVISGASLPTGTTFVSSVDTVARSITLSNNVSGAGGTAAFEAIGPTDQAANGGGLILQGSTTNKTILYDNTRSDKYWVFSENLEIKANRHIAINGVELLSGTTLGSTVLASSLTSVGTLTSLTVSGEAKFGGRIVESNDNQFNTALTPVANVLTINTATSNTICGTPAAAAINTWAFTNTNLNNGESLTITLVLDANTSALYGDDCTVDGSTITNGVKWSGGSPPLPTNNYDILTFIIVKDGAGTVQVFGQGNTDFS